VDNLRGHAIQKIAGQWVYCDTGEPTAGNRRDCGHCRLQDTPEGHDGCLGTLPDVANACCGHGDPDAVYIQFKDGRILRGSAASGFLMSLG
jgi:hypothetical protein